MRACSDGDGAHSTNLAALTSCVLTMDLTWRLWPLAGEVMHCQ